MDKKNNQEYEETKHNRKNRSVLRDLTDDKKSDETNADDPDNLNLKDLADANNTQVANAYNRTLLNNVTEKDDEEG